ncbi:CPBP family intramembrane glutamic endopeptidase [Pseudooceanicola sp.]|uniref:CPBP family intramembrane glutamic endopeptidase n=1 Tax=Pseudooceanicola sp. TaxID=1914328 RepID=UPI002604DAEE|nr:CPBP family intramembrane glutamic endopeptidase [Pseudooceanicola sp.]MDF1857226.1 CPBP family intramembrane metalloprotease [Pseudooceanicola sp.]
MTPAIYARHPGFAAPARASRALWRLVFGILAVEFMFAFLLSLFDQLIGAINPALAEDIFYGATPVGLILQLASFALLGLCLASVMQRQHGRSIWSAVGRIDEVVPTLIAVFGAVATLYIVIELLPPWWSRDALTDHRNPLLWLLTVPIGLTALLIQISTEEILYRGYIQQQLAARFNATWVWLLVPNLLFAAAHWDNGESLIESWHYVIWAFCFGLAASDLTARTGNLGAAMGLHLANNAYAFLLFGEAGGADSGLALLLFPAAEAGGADPAGTVLDLQLMIDLGVVWLSWLTARLVIRR